MEVSSIKYTCSSYVEPRQTTRFAPSTWIQEGSETLSDKYALARISDSRYGLWRTSGSTAGLARSGHLRNVREARLEINLRVLGFLVLLGHFSLGFAALAGIRKK